MIHIKNKQESLQFIKSHHLNHFGETIFYQHDIQGVKKFLQTYPVDFYFLRELMPASPHVFYDLSADQVLEKVSQYKCFGLDVSSKNVDDQRLLCGEIKLQRQGDFILSASTNKESTHRVFLEPHYFLNTSIIDKKLKYIPGLLDAIDYFYQHQLFDIIIEFCVFSTPVGIYQHKVVIYEVRTDY